MFIKIQWFRQTWKIRDVLKKVTFGAQLITFSRSMNLIWEGAVMEISLVTISQMPILWSEDYFLATGWWTGIAAFTSCWKCCPGWWFVPARYWRRNTWKCCWVPKCELMYYITILKLQFLSFIFKNILVPTYHLTPLYAFNIVYTQERKISLFTDIDVR